MECPVCERLNDDAARFCRNCGSTLSSGVSAPGELSDILKPTAPTKRAVGKSPIVALIFSFVVPGLGQFYNGDFKKGLMILILTVVALFLLPETACSSSIPLIAVWLWGVINAYNVAAGKTPLWS